VSGNLEEGKVDKRSKLFYWVRKEGKGRLNRKPTKLTLGKMRVERVKSNTEAM